jgi:hypothetical protein
VTTLSAGWLSVRDNFAPLAFGPDPSLHVQGWVDMTCTVIMMICVSLVLIDAVRQWTRVITGRTAPPVQVAEAEA